MFNLAVPEIIDAIRGFRESRQEGRDALEAIATIEDILIQYGMIEQDEPFTGLFEGYLSHKEK